VAAEREQLGGAVAPVVVVVGSDLGGRQFVNSQIAVATLDLVGTSLVRKLLTHHQPHTGCSLASKALQISPVLAMDTSVLGSAHRDTIP
jgi:hypothetical protein